MILDVVQQYLYQVNRHGTCMSLSVDSNDQ